MPASNAILIDLTDAEKRKAAFSLLYLGHNIGFAASPLFIGFFIEKSSLLWVWPLLFLLGIMAAAALFLLYRIEKTAIKRLG